MEYLNKIIQGNCKEKLKLLPDKSVRCCVTSPPYYGLRDYGCVEQIGIEESPSQFISSLVNDVFSEVHRVLADDGTLWLNIGDSYASAPTGGNDQTSSTLQGGKKNQIEGGRRPDKSKFEGIKPKDLIGIPWMLAFALRSAGWYLRQEIIWHKPNPMPESVTDRCTKSHESIFLLSKTPTYYYDYEAIKTPGLNPEDDVRRMLAQEEKHKSAATTQINGLRPKTKRGHKLPHTGFDAKWDNMSLAEQRANGANKRSVWTVPTKPYREAHFATFPPELIIDCIKAGSAPGDIVLDPFSGAGTTAMVAAKLDRNFIAIELNQKYIDIANKRLDKELGMFRK